MPDRCVVANCSNVTDPAKRIFGHNIPFFGDSRPVAIKQRKKWVDFVQLCQSKTRQMGSNKTLCSVDDNIFQYSLVPELGKLTVPRLKRDEIGVVVFPTIQEKCE